MRCDRRHCTGQGADPPAYSRCYLNITAYDHVGIRVTDRVRSLAFYRTLGFELDEENSTETAAEILNAAGVRLNLILNGVPTPDGDNVLLDRPQKWPGYTHAAFIVDSLPLVLDWASNAGIPITEGPHDWGRRLTCFLRDPDSNVLEFNELKSEPASTPKYTLIIGPKNYSSWSMRAWLLLKVLGLPFAEQTVPLYQPGSRDHVRGLGGETGLVPVLLEGDAAIWDTLAIFEHLYEAHPAVWPAHRYARAHARSLSGEVHAGFSALRSAMPVNTRARNRIARRSEAVEADIQRVVEIWTSLGGSSWLFGDFCAADIMFAPIATRFQTYGVELEGLAGDYMDRLLRHSLTMEWLELGRLESSVIPLFEP